MTSRWPTARLGDVLTRSQDTTVLDPDRQYHEITVRLWGKGVVRRGVVLGANVAAQRRFVARQNQFILSRIDARNGALGIVPPELDGAIVTNDFPLFSIDDQRLLPAFLGWACKTASFVEKCRRASEGTTNRVRLQEEKFLELETPLPPLTEQRRVVAQIEAIARSVLGAREEREESLLAVEALWSSAAARVLAVDGSQTRPLLEVVEVRGGGTPSKADPLYWQGNIPWVSPKDMKSRELHDSIDHISEAAARETPAKLIEPGAVLVVVRGMILAHTVPVAVLRVAAAINQDMKALLPRPGLSPEYLCAILWAKNSTLLAAVEKSTHDTRKLQTPRLLGVEIPVPQLSAQRRAVEELKTVESKIAAVEEIQAATTAELDAVLPAILDRAFRGELL